MNISGDISHAELTTINIPLNGKNLIITGKNGSGKTSFLNALNEKISLHLSKNGYLTNDEKRAIEWHENQIKNFQKGSNEYSNSLTQLNYLYERRSRIEQGLKLNFKNELDFISSFEEIKAVFISFKAMRVASITEAKSTSSIEDEKVSAKQIVRNNKDKTFSNKLEQHLLNIKVNQSLAITVDSNQTQANQFQEWFNNFDNHLKFLFENDRAHLVFHRQNFKFKISLGNREFDFQTLSSGYLAVFEILADLLVRSEYFEITPDQLKGIILIDEIDAHLHISLQKKILPFFTRLFPQIQFIVSTHSPFVITSTDNDTVVYDISSGDFFEEDLSIYSHESIIKELFHVQDENENLKALSDQLVQFIELEIPSHDLEVIQNLLNEINKNFDKLSVELQLQYMVAKNKLTKLKHEGK